MLSSEWKKARKSGAAGHCVEVAINPEIPGKVFVRDSKNRVGPVLTFTAEEWEAFLDGAAGGEFNL